MKDLLIALLLVCSLGAAENLRASSGSDEKTPQGAAHADEAVNKLVLDTETSELKKVLTDDFTYINSSGQIMDKDKWIGDLKSGMQFDSFTSRDVKARVYGETAVVTGRLFTVDSDIHTSVCMETRSMATHCLPDYSRE